MLVVVVRSLVSNWTKTRHFSKLLAQNSNIGLKRGELALFPGSVQICVLYLHAIKLTNLTFVGHTVKNRSKRSAVYGFFVHRMIAFYNAVLTWIHHVTTELILKILKSSFWRSFVEAKCKMINVFPKPKSEEMNVSNRVYSHLRMKYEAYSALLSVESH